jgi:hypothetical protein
MMPPRAFNEEKGPGAQEDEYWKSCCFKLDPRTAHFFTMLALTIVMLTFSFYMIISTNPCETGPVWALVGACFAFWFENPRIKKQIAPTQVTGLAL